MRVIELLNEVDVGVMGYFASLLSFDEEETRSIFEVLEEARGMCSHYNDEGIEIYMEMDLELADLMVVGRTNFEECVDLAFNNWESWLGFSIEGDTLMMWETELVALYILREMSLWGASHKEVLTNIGHEMLVYM